MQDLEDLFERLKRAMQALDELFQEATDELARSHGQLFRVESWDKDTGERFVEYMDEERLMQFYRDEYEGHRTWGQLNLTAEEYVRYAMRDTSDAVENKYAKMVVTYLGKKG
jgi:hypothetical protein